MKNRCTTLVLLILFQFILSAEAVAQAKMSREEKKSDAFSKMVQLVESKQFRFEADFAYPIVYPAVDLHSNYNFLDVRDTIAEISMPYFGRAYSINPGEEGGFHANGPMIKYKKVMNEKKMRCLITFELRNGNDHIEISMEVFGNNSCSLNIISNKRTSISYKGEIKEIPKSEEESR